MTILVTSTTCTTRMCIEYDYMHVHTLHYATNYAESESAQYDRKQI